jgi:hypothetical protein
MVSQLIRLGRLYNRGGRDGLLGVGRTKLFSDLLLRDDDNPNIPGTTVRRMQTVRLGPKTIGVPDTEVQRVTSELTKAPRNRKAP